MKHLKYGLFLIIPMLLVSIACNRDPKAQARSSVEKGNKFFEKAKYTQAAIMYRRALQKDALNGEAYYQLGLTYLKLDAWAEAARSLRRATTLPPREIDATVKLADVYLTAYIAATQKDNKLLAEIKLLDDTLLRKDPKSFDGLRLAGYLALANKDLPRAIKNFQAAEQVRPLDHQIVVALCQSLMANNQFPEAEKLGWSLIAKDKYFIPIYDLLYVSYYQRNQIPEAEKVLKAKIDNTIKVSDSVIQLAVFYYTQKRWPEAESALQRITSNIKDYPDGHLQVGQFFARTRQFDRARRQFEEGIKAFPKQKAFYQDQIAAVLIAQDKMSEASQMVEAVLKETPKDIQALSMRAALSLHTGSREQVQAAVNDYQSLVTRMPNNPIFRYNLARALVAKGAKPDRAQAILHLQEAIKLRADFIAARILLSQVYLSNLEYGKALKESDDTLAIDSTNISARLIRSNALMNTGDKGLSRQELNTVLKASPDNIDARFQLAFLEYIEKNYKEAAGSFRQLYQSYPNDIRGLVGLVETEVAMGDFQSAIKQLKEQLDRDPSRSEYRLTLANTYVNAEQYDQAIPIFQDLIKANPKSEELYSKLAETYRLKGDFNTAIETFHKASALAPNDPNPLVELALLYDGTGQKDRARPIYDQILKLQPDNAVALNNLAYLKAEEGSDLDQALTYATLAVQKAPNVPAITDTLGYVYIKKSMSQDAAKLYRTLVTKEPANPLFRYHLAMVLQQLGDRASAKKELEIALKNKPTKEDENRIRELMNKLN